MREGAILLLDEGNFLEPGAVGGLNRILDTLRNLGGASYHIPETGELVEAHPDFRIAMTGNAINGVGKSSYRGTKPLNQALLDRFTLGLNVAYMSANEEVAMLKRRSPAVNLPLIALLVEVAGGVRASFDDGTLRCTMSTRVLSAVCAKLNDCPAEHQASLLKPMLDATLLFRVAPEDRTSIVTDKSLKGKNFAVIIDEAYASQTGTTAAKLQTALAMSGAGKMSGLTVEELLEQLQKSRARPENISYFAFTGTPKHSTLMLFGRPPDLTRKSSARSRRWLPEQLGFSFDPVELGKWQDAMFAKIVNKCGNRRYWEDWAKDIAEIADRHQMRIRALLDKPHSKGKKAFDEFLKGVRKNLNPSVSQNDAVEMLAQHAAHSTATLKNSLYDSYNNKSLAHDNPILNYEESLLIFNHVAASIRFIKALELKIKQKAEAAKKASWEDDIDVPVIRDQVASILALKHGR